MAILIAADGRLASVAGHQDLASGRWRAWRTDVRRITSLNLGSRARPANHVARARVQDGNGTTVTQTHLSDEESIRRMTKPSAVFAFACRCFHEVSPGEIRRFL
jgi:hypothetical protein